MKTMRMTLMSTAAACFLAAGMTAASAQQNPATTRNMDVPTAGGVGDNPQAMRDNSFLRHANDGGYAEVQFGQLAGQKGSSDEVKKFGHTMVDDHTAMNAKLKPFCDAAGIAPPTKLAKADQKEYDKLNGMSGADFDKEYLSYMEKDHKKDLQEFQAEKNATTNAQLKAVVSSGADTIKQHLEMVQKLNAGH